MKVLDFRLLSSPVPRRMSVVVDNDGNVAHIQIGDTTLSVEEWNELEERVNDIIMEEVFGLTADEEDDFDE